MESACVGATSAASELERALIAAARDQARDLPPLANEARLLATDLAHIGNLRRNLGTAPILRSGRSGLIRFYTLIFTTISNVIDR